MAVPAAAWAVVGSYALMVLSNVLAQKKFFGGKDNKELSDTHPTYLTPDGKTFAVWGMIYMLETVMVVAQVMPSDRTEEIFGQQCSITGLNVRERLVLAFLANSIWLPVFNNERFWAGLGIMMVYLAALLGVYQDLNVETTQGVFERVVFVAGVSMNVSWIIVAFSVSIFFCAGLAGWQDEHGVAGSVPAAMAVIVLVTLLAVQRAVVACDLAWAFVAAWALQGIYRMQTVPDKVRFPLGAMNATLGTMAKVCSGGTVAAMVLGVGLAMHQRSS
eukprot:TRINITY_DN94049_c0_g1_i1.p1 TRINITY_DN94049_c0_g1~~TRINITY_DN94049_c0_g1_i1.p1  ORF type:complete len:274 (-),score=48.88 TRINITY_DN94049_c0_g1_i1:60-881(-)